MSEERSGISDPLLRRLYDYWDGKRAGRSAPTRADIHPEELTFILPFLYLIDVVGTPPRFQFRLAGTGIVTEFGGELTGKFADEIDLDNQQTAIIAEYERVVRSAKPISSRWNYTKYDGRQLSYEHVILPLSSDGRAVDMLLGGALIRGVGGSKA
jgi:hypothetical protein